VEDAKNVLCIFKKGSSKECSNYQPISFLCIPSKIPSKSGLCAASQPPSHLQPLKWKSMEFQSSGMYERLTVAHDMVMVEGPFWGKGYWSPFSDFKRTSTASHMISYSKSLWRFRRFSQLHSQLSKQYTVEYRKYVNSEDKQLDYGVP